MAKMMLVSEIVAPKKGNFLGEILLSDAELNELIEDVRVNGIRVPLIVQKGTNVLIDGFNRLAVAKKLKIVEVPVDVQDIKEKDIEMTQYLLQLGRRNIDPAKRKLIVGRLINAKKLRADEEAKHGMKKNAAAFAGKVAKIVDDSEGKLSVKDAQKLVKTKGVKGAMQTAKEVKKTGESAKVVVAKAVIEKKTKMTPHQLVEQPMRKFEEAFDEYPQFQAEFKKIFKSFLESL